MIRISLIAMAATLIAAPAAFGLGLPEKAVNFQLTDHMGVSHEFFRLNESPAVVIVSVDLACSEMARQAEALRDLQSAFQSQGVEFLAINPDPANDREGVAGRLADWNLSLPVLMDTSQTVARALGLTRSAEVLVITPEDSWAIAYRGAIDAEALTAALEAVLGGDSVPGATPSTGRPIEFAFDTGSLSFTHDIAPILEEKCISCHHLGGIGPFAFSSLRRVRGWAPMMTETILTERMPPWHADKYHREYRHALGLTNEERAKLLAWLGDGAPDDLDGADDPLELAADLREQTWALGEPDLIISMPERQELPADGVIEYQYIYIPSGLTENKWVKSIQVQPGNTKVLHHALIFILYPKEYRHLQPDSRGGLNGYFGAFLPGGVIEPYPDNSAQWVPAGATFVFQMHYTATGRPETDLTRMGLYFMDEEPAYEFRMAAASDTNFTIPPRAANHVTQASFTFDEPARLWAASPHMHYRGSWFEFEVRPPDSSPTTVLRVPRFDFNWQPLYLFEEPVPMPAGTTIYCEGGFDNTAYNPLNPNPDAQVTFGEQSWEEMFIGYLGYTIPADATDRTPLPAEQTAQMGLGKPITEESLGGTTWRVGRQFELEFKVGGDMLANGQLPGRWRIENNVIYLESAFRNFELPIVGDEIFFQGRSMRVVREGDGEFQPWQPGQGRGGRGGGGGQRGGQGQGPSR
jgi:peroxiredoxin